MKTDEQRIREFAFQIWESEGRPQGQHERHWQMACKLAEAEAEAAAQPQPAAKPKRISKPKTVPLSEAEQPALLKKPRAPRSSTPKTPKL
ncbi:MULTISPECIES: DUF2934 domain-containing protein [Pseudomonadaceae]|jgi:hypothetical protein|uniref:DUF2934 domain-containing protein n=2 Tax=Ectopseudomonas TaxID=3236654 RepID=A4XUM3_ECTM1|nr:MULTISPECIES: DUF2934 domain-containing protein [Pseudomonas]ARS48970.1 hypothetical protein PSMEN_11385 [Pseudomonas mendocina]EJO91667.1 hypothetical protein A471_22108 [Pseudomonas mendocina DLHK]ATH82197.1 DUF2934 domain-containing protein [Pseudomonas mendocina]MBF8163723.1 DUF2934 domain-containing protein [Pseudomonas mendocina]MDH0098313.1 DUF2934 domain-containing protein [Pseudomonas sp. GD04158]